MNTPPANPNALAWRLTIAAVCLQLLCTILVQVYLVQFSPMADQMRTMYGRPEMVATTVVQAVAVYLLLGLTTWCTTQRWLRRHDAHQVDRPGRMTATLLAVSLVLFVLISAGLALLQNAFYKFVIDHDTFGYYGAARVLVMALPLKLCGILITVLAGWLAVRIAAWSVTPASRTGAPPYRPRHAAWIAALTLLLWQLHVGLMLGSYFKAYALSAQLLEYAIGYWILPAVILALAAWACLKSLPRTLDTAGAGRAIAHGTFAFWLAQVLGVGLAVLVIWQMNWSQLVRAGESYTTTVVSLLIYGALVTLGCHAGARLFYRRRETPPPTAPA